MRHIMTAAVAGALAVIAPAGAAAQQTSTDWADKSGAIGLGGNVTLGGTGGIDFRLYLSEAFGLQITLGFEMSHDDDADNTALGVRVGAYGALKMASFTKGHLSLLFGLDLAVDRDNPNADDKALEPSVGFGLMAEWFVARHFSLYAQTGLRVTLVNREEGGGMTADTSGFDVSLGSDLFGGAGFTVWFD